MHTCARISSGDGGASRGSKEVLRGLSFSVPAGATVGVVGSSGCGKSTLLRLLMRFYDPDAGVVRLGGVDVRDVSLASLRAALSVVPQDCVLFNDTIAYNIRYGRPGASADDVAAAASLARLAPAIADMPAGYDTVVGERGLKLSGGEKQRVAIARAVLKRSPVLLCDEATSALDSRTEGELMAMLRRASREGREAAQSVAGAAAQPGSPPAAPRRTTLLIAHRLSTVADADEILVLHAGRVVERGTHAALLALPGGRYRDMWHAQQAQAQALQALPAAAATEQER